MYAIIDEISSDISSLDSLHKMTQSEWNDNMSNKFEGEQMGQLLRLTEMFCSESYSMASNIQYNKDELYRIASKY